MNDGLNHIKHAYGEESKGPAPTPGTPAHAEFEALRTMKEALDGLPHSLPNEDVMDAVKDAAIAETLLPLQQAYGEDVAALDADDWRIVEFELLRTTKSVLDTLPTVRPDASVLEAVKAAAVSQVFAPLQAVYGEGATPELDSSQHAEYRLLSTTKESLDQLPADRPDASVVAAVLAAAKPGTPTTKVAADRPARSASNIRRWTPVLAMAASVVIVAVTGLWVAQVFPVSQQAAESELLADTRSSAADDSDAFASPAEPEAGLEEAPTAGLFGPLAGGGQPTVSQDRLQGYVAARRPAAARPVPSERREVVNPPPAPQAGGRVDDVMVNGETILADAVADLNETDTNKPVAVVSDWDAGEDVRVLSLRLNQLANSSEGLSWDEPPTPLGAAESTTDAPMEGIRAARAGASPARVDVQMRSGEQRDDQ